MGLLKSIATVGGFTLISRVLGFIRDILIAGLLGAGTLADVFFVAFKLPNLFRRLFAEGAFNAAFVPIFSGLIETDGKNAAQKFAEEALAGLLWTLLGFVVLFELLMPFIMVGFAPGFMGNAAKFDLAVLLTRITFPYLLFISLVSLMGGVLNSLGRFSAAAATPIFLNICLIGAILVLTTMMPTAAHVVAHVFRVNIDPFIGRLGVFRIHQGTVTKDSQLFIGDGRKPFRVGHCEVLLTAAYHRAKD